MNGRNPFEIDGYSRLKHNMTKEFSFGCTKNKLLRIGKYTKLVAMN